MSWIKQFNREKRLEFEALGNGGYYYTEQQKELALSEARQNGIRATARLLKIPRRTLQRWTIKHGVFIKRCPAWVYEWARHREKRRDFWRRRGYC